MMVAKLIGQGSENTDWVERCVEACMIRGYGLYRITVITNISAKRRDGRNEDKAGEPFSRASAVEHSYDDRPHTCSVFKAHCFRYSNTHMREYHGDASQDSLQRS